MVVEAGASVAVEKEHESIAVFLEEKEQVDRLLAGQVVLVPSREIAFPGLFETKGVPTRCFHCPEYGHTHMLP